MTSAQSSANDTSILIFGASGDLTARKLIPALFKLSQQGFLSERSPVIGVARREKTDDQFRNELKEASLATEFNQINLKRLVHCIETIVLAKNLPIVATPEVVQRYQQILELEQMSL